MHITIIIEMKNIFHSQIFQNDNSFGILQEKKQTKTKTTGKIQFLYSTQSRFICSIGKTLINQYEQIFRQKYFKRLITSLKNYNYMLQNLHLHEHIE